MDKCELTELGYDTNNLVAGIDYAPDLDTAAGEVDADFVERAQLQATELNALGGVSILGGSPDCLDKINLALDDGIDLVMAVKRYGDEEQERRVRQLIDAGRVSS